MTASGFADPRYLITPQDLSARFSEVVLIDLRPAEDFALGRIEGARHLDLYGISLNDSAEAPLNAFLGIFPTLFGARGVTHEKPVVIYDHESGERASRAVWLLALLGHADVRMLDGGTGAWVASGRALARVTQAPPHPEPATTPPTPPPFKANIKLDFVATRFDVHGAIDDAGAVIVDVRRASEYRGDEKRARRAGTIPGAEHVFWRDHLDGNGAFKPPQEMRRLYESKGVTPDKSVITVCHGGYRSASTFLALKSLGYPRVRNYVSSWGEWGNRDDSRIVVPNTDR